MNLRKLGLKPKIVIGFGSLLAIIAGMGLVGYRSAVVSEKPSQEVEIDSANEGHYQLDAGGVFAPASGRARCADGREQ